MSSDGISAKVKKMRLHELGHDLKACRKEVEVVSDRYYAAEQRFKQVQEDILRDTLAENKVAVIIGHWECKKSPVGVCVYNLESLLGDDECIYCGMPDERK